MTTGFTTALEDKTSEPLPLEKDFEGSSLAQRIWIGNMDTKITEYTMVQILKKFGKIKQFDFLVHKTGPLEGQPRGYCFVSFEKEADAARAILKLNNLPVLSKKLQVRWAHNQPLLKVDPKKTLKLPSDDADKNALPLRTHRYSSPEATINAIEAKLKEMERTKNGSSSSASSSSVRLHPLLALAKQNAAAKEASKPYRKRHRR